MSQSFEFQQTPGHLIRRLHQFAVATFMDACGRWDITPVQFSILQALMEGSGCDQVTLAQRVAFDAATSGSVIARLEKKGWLRRELDADDRRRKLLWVTPEGERLVNQMADAAADAQKQLLAPLNDAERTVFSGFLATLVSAHAERD